MHVNEHIFINEKDITQLLKKNGAAIAKPISEIHLQQLETLLRQQPWIYNAELFFDNNQVLTVKILEREPLARIFLVQGTSFYIDSSGMRLPLSDDYSARVPMFTAFTSTKQKLLKPDSLLMNDIRRIATIIQQDSFWNAQVSQVNITPTKTFEIIPALGNQVIKLGNGDSLESKFDRLTAFYKQVWAKERFEKYESISVEFGNQVVAVKRGAPKPIIDYAQSQRLINAMRNGANIIKDTTFALHKLFSPLPFSTIQSDTLVRLKIETVVLNKSSKLNTSTKLKGTASGTSNEVLKIRRKASG